MKKLLLGILISKNTIEKVFELARVEEVIEDFLSLKKSGSNYKALSPFSQERTPSFMVSPSKQIWKDFSSGKGGNVVSFIMEHESFSYPEAIRYLAKKYNIEIEETELSTEDKEKINERESLFLILEYAQSFFQEELWEQSEGKSIGLSYFKERGFTEATLKTFGVGYSRKEKDAFTKKALKAGYDLKLLEKTGLVILTEQGNIDRFRERVLFPIRNFSGKVLGFGGRILSQKKNIAKYINSPESLIYNKSETLFGIYQAKTSIVKADKCYLVEGYTDVLQLHQLGVQNVVSTSGTSLTSQQIRLVERFTKNVILLFDGDSAGLRASMRGIDIILEQGLYVKICSFPDGEDPDSFAKNNSYEEVISYLEKNTKDFIEYKASILEGEIQKNPIEKVKLIREIIESISKIPDTIQQNIYIDRCAEIMKQPREMLSSVLFQILDSNQRKQQQKEVRKEEQQENFKEVILDISDNFSQKECEKRIVKILLLYGDRKETFEEVNINEEPRSVSRKVFEKIFLELQQDEIDFTTPDFKLLYNILKEKYEKNIPLIMEKFINELPPNISKWVVDFVTEKDRYRLSKIWEQTPKYSVADDLTQVILNLRRLLIKQKVEALKEKTNDIEDSQSIIQDVYFYNELNKKIGEKLNRVIN